MIKRLFSWWRNGPVCAGLVLTFGVVLAFAPDMFLAMLLRAFLWQWALALLILALWNVWRRHWWIASASVIASALALWPPLDVVHAEVGTGGTSVLRVAQMNVLQPNDDHAEVLAAALATEADVISFQEVSPAWASRLVSVLAPVYPYHRLVPGTDCYGIALFSRYPFERADIVELSRNPAVDVQVRTGSGIVRILAVHASSPGGFYAFRDRNHQLETVAGWVNGSVHPTILIGDLNTVSWDRAMVRLCARTGLREHPDNVTPTWPVVAGIALIPLDHVLVNAPLAVSALSTFPIPGSDHKGVVANIQLRA